MFRHHRASTSNNPDFLLALKLHQEINGSSNLNYQREIENRRGSKTFNANLPRTHAPAPFYPWKLVRNVITTNAATPRLAFTIPNDPPKPVPTVLCLTPPRESMFSRDMAGPSTSCRTVKENPINQAAGSISSIRISPQDFYVVRLNGYLMSNSVDWTEVNILPNLKLLVSLVTVAFFRKGTGVKKYEFKWSYNFQDQTNFKFVQQTVELNAKTLPKFFRGRLLSVLIHAMIHISVFESSSSCARQINDHDINFNEIKTIFNEKLDLEIGSGHSFLRNEEEKLMFTCKTCSSSSFPVVFQKANESLPAQLVCPQKCSGQLHEVFEATRIINDVTETKFFINVHEPRPKPLPGARAANNANPRELVDITDDQNAPKVENLIPVIDVTNEDAAHGRVRKIVQLFRDLPAENFRRCPFCSVLLGKQVGALKLHIELCNA